MRRVTFGELACEDLWLLRIFATTLEQPILPQETSYVLAQEKSYVLPQEKPYVG